MAPLVDRVVVCDRRGEPRQGNKGDQVDADQLSELLRRGALRAVYHGSAHRADLNYILGELIGELGTSHTYVGGGDTPDVPKVDVGLLGADYELDAASRLYRFKRIYSERDWNSKVAAPLGEPGVNVRGGDYLLAVNSQPVSAPENLYAAFIGTKDTGCDVPGLSSLPNSKPQLGQTS